MRLIFGLALALVASPALAQQTTDSNASSQSFNQVIVGSNGTSTDIDQRVRNVPHAMAPMLPGGANPCVVGMSAATSVVGFGGSVSGSWNDQDCERRNLSIILFNAAHKFGDPLYAEAAMEVLCNNGEVSEAMALVGRPCRSRVQQAQVPQQSNDWEWVAEAGR